MATASPWSSAYPLRDFDRVAHGVAEVQDLAASVLALVRRDDRGLDRDAAFHDGLEGVERAGQAGSGRPRDVVRVGRVGDDAVLDRLRAAGRDLIAGQRGERLDVGEDEPGRVERADEVLARRQVHAGLAADGRVHHREHGGGYLHVRNAAMQRRGDEAAQVAGDAAAQRHDGGIAAETRGDHPVAQVGPRVTHLVPLAGREDERSGGESVRFQQGAHPLAVQRGHATVGDHGVGVRGAAFREQLGQPGEDAASRDDVVRRVAPFGRGDADHHVTSGCPARALACRASTNSRSESRFR